MRSEYSAAIQAQYLQDGYWQDETLPGALARWAEQFSDRVALRDQLRNVTYAELASQVDQLATGFARIGISSDDRILVQMPNNIEFVLVFFALIKVGALPVLALPAHGVREIIPLAEVSSAKGYIGSLRHSNDSDYRALATQLKNQVAGLQTVIFDGDDSGYQTLAGLFDEAQSSDVTNSTEVAFFLLSGGTTSIPKLIPRTHADYLYNLCQVAQVCEVDEHTRYLVALPIAHNFALGCPGALGVLNAGGMCVLANSPDMANIAGLIEQHSISFTALVPSMVELLLQAAELDIADFSSLKLIQVGGAPFSPDSASRVINDLQTNLQQVFGMSEGLICCTRLDDHADVKINTQGQPVSPADEVKIVNEQGIEDSSGIGQLCVRGPYTIPGYFNASEQNQVSFDAEGYYQSGDLVERRADGNYRVIGRAKEQINRAGEKYAPSDVENCIAAHPGVLQCALVSKPDLTLGEKTTLFLVATNTLTNKTQVINFLLQQELAKYKLPDAVTFLDRMPLTSLGKIDKKKLAAELLADKDKEL